MRKIFLACFLALWLSACGQTTTVPPVPSKTLSGELIKYQSPTPSQTPSPMPAVSTPVLTPLPSPTPFTHTIIKDDTMLGIALRYGVSLEELQAANPGVDPGFLVIGQTLIIPLEGDAPAAIPLPTPLPVTHSAPQCYPSADDGLWCFMLVTNDQPDYLENLSGWITLYDDLGNQVGAQAAVSPLNRLPPGASLPLMAFFSALPLNSSRVQGQLASALAVDANDQRYLAADLLIKVTQIGGNGAYATASGEVVLPQGSVPGSVWLLAVAYDAGDNVVGVRKLDLGAPTDTSFEIVVYSLGPSITRVELLVEARP